MAVPVPAVEAASGGSALLDLLEAHPNVVEFAEYGADEEDLAALEEALGHDVPEQLAELLRLSDGGALHGPTRTVSLASAEELMTWALRGVMHELEAMPFARDDHGTVLVVDTGGDWGDEGSIYRLETGRRSIRGYPVGDAVRIAGSLTELIAHVAAGREAW